MLQMLALAAISILDATTEHSIGEQNIYTFCGQCNKTFSVFYSKSTIKSSIDFQKLTFQHLLLFSAMTTDILLKCVQANQANQHSRN